MFRIINKGGKGEGVFGFKVSGCRRKNIIFSGMGEKEITRKGGPDLVSLDLKKIKEEYTWTKRIERNLGGRRTPLASHGSGGGGRWFNTVGEEAKPTVMGVRNEGILIWGQYGEITGEAQV